MKITTATSPVLRAAPLLGLAALSLTAVAQADPPLTITQGGTYSGNYQSTDGTPAITVNTTQPVVITNCTVSGPGNLIFAPISGSNVTVSYTTGTNNAGQGKSTGNFFYAYQPAAINIHNCDIGDTASGSGPGFGILINGYGGSASANYPLSIAWNRFRNINGLSSSNAPHAIQISNASNIPGVDIGYNEIIDDPYASYVNDVINIYAGGTPNTPINVHNNYIQGLYAANPTDTDPNHYNSGCGIICDSDQAAYTHIYNNQVISTSNCGISIAGGHDNSFWGNRILSSGLLPDGTTAIYDQNNGAQLVNEYNTYYNNFASDPNDPNNTHPNLIGWLRQPFTIHNPTSQATRGGDVNFDLEPNERGKQTYWGNGPSVQDEENEGRSWAQMLSNNNFWVGNNLIIDPGFEAQIGSNPGGTLAGHWRADVGSGAGAGTDIDQPGNPESGHINAWVHNPAGTYGAYAAQDGIAVQPNTTYILSAACWDITGGTVGGGGAEIGAWSDDWSRNLGDLRFTPATGGYAPAGVTFTTGPSDTRIHIEIGISGQTRDAYMRIDDVQLTDPVVKPATPAGLKAVAGASGAKQITLTWNKVTGTSSYKVYWASSSGGTYSQTGTATTASYTNMGLTAGTTYFYKVAAVNAAGTGGQSSAVSAKAQ